MPVKEIISVVLGSGVLALVLQAIFSWKGVAGNPNTRDGRMNIAKSRLEDDLRMASTIPDQDTRETAEDGAKAKFRKELQEIMKQ